MQTIFDAVAADDIAAVQEFIDSGNNLDIYGPEDRTLLESAIELGKNEIAKLLIDAGARIHATEGEQIGPNTYTTGAWSALTVAAWSNNIEIARYLLSKGANIDDKDTSSGFRWAAKEKHLAMMQFLIDKGYDVNCSDYGTPILHILIQDECPLESIELLLANGADPNKKGRHDYYPLELTPHGNNLSPSAVALLIKHGATLDTDHIKKILRHWASKKTYIKSVYMFGSRARGNHRASSDLDIAVELIGDIDESGGLATWMHKCDKWKNELQSLLPIDIQLEWYDGERTEIIHKGIVDSGILLFKKET